MRSQQGARDGKQFRGVLGYLEDSQVQQGQLGTPILQDTKTYIGHTYNAATVYLLASDTVYRNTDGTGSETTNYAYTWPNGTNQPPTITITNPTVSQTEDGPGTASTEVDTYDQYNRLTQVQNGNGNLTTYGYDLATGAMTQSVVDSATGHLNLTTNTTVDGLGRPLEVTSPAGNVTVFAYLDTQHQVRIYSGWNSTSDTVTGPVEVDTAFYPTTTEQTLYDETLTEVPTTTIHLGSNGLPDGGEAIGTVERLSRTLTNSAGQISEKDDYFSLSGQTYSPTTLYLGSSSNNTAGGNFHATSYGYNDDGLQDRVKMPTGTIYRTVYDDLERPVSHWVGTNDTPTSGTWSPTNNTGTSNMTDVQDIAYDNAGAGTTPALSAVAGGTIPDTIYYVTITFQTATGETPASAPQSIDVPDNNLLSLAVPTNVPSGATGWNVYVSTAVGSEQKQNSSALSLTSGWTEPTTGLVAGTLANYSGVGDGNVTEIFRHSGSSDPDRVSQMLFDFRDRLIGQKDGVQPVEDTAIHRPIVFYALDNLDEVTGAYRYDGDQISLNDFANGLSSLPAADAQRLRGEILTSFDELQRPYETQVFSVDRSSGAASNPLDTYDWYDNDGNRIKVLSPGGLVRKYLFDGADREITAYSTDGGGDGTPASANAWSGATDVTGDIVLSQVETQLDKDGNPVFVTDRERFHDDAGTGALGTPTTGNLARVYYSADYYDAIDRPTDSVNLGTNGGTVLTSPPALNNLPAGSLHTSYQYLYPSTGEEIVTTDPRGIQSETFQDLLGRTTQTVAGHTNGSPAATINQTTNYTYNGDGQTLQMTAVMPGGTNQTTAYVYGPSPSGGYTLHDNDLLARTECPDPSTGLPSTSGSNDQTWTYNGLGDVVETYHDENGSVHAYVYDVLGRLAKDELPLHGSGVDATVGSQGYTYDTNGQLSTASTYANTSATGNAAHAGAGSL